MGSMAALAAPPERIGITVDELHALVERGAFGDRKVELWDGVIEFETMGSSLAHGRHHRLLLSALERVCRPGEEAVNNCSVRFADASELDPDVSVVWIEDVEYPTPEMVRIVGEVSVSTLFRDLNAKRVRYARAAIPEYWVVDVEGRALHVFTRPENGDYAEHSVYVPGERVGPVEVAALFVEPSAPSEA
jgi:Uma2 family endonuclease